MSDLVRIDGARGEGGGQVFRTSLALAALTGRPIQFDNIRGKRKKPGLLRQHLTAARAVAEISGGSLVGDELKSQTLTFEPGPVRGGDYEFSIGSAGSASLVFQTVLWPLLFADAPSRVVFEGGTHNPMAPTFDFIVTSFLPLLRRMGARVEARLERHGFYPAGGGRFVIDVEPVESLTAIELIDGGPVRATRARALVSALPPAIARRELDTLRQRLDLEPSQCSVEVVRSNGPGNVVMVEIELDQVTELITAFGEKGVRAERVARRAAVDAKSFIASGVPVGKHLADQLIIPLALARGGMFRTLEPSLHTTTNIGVVAELLEVDIHLESEGEGITLISVAG